ncbi:hypothetical protein F5J12DRAFT_779114 [Pisolithus orientalis]|uniref:uncharacterized protein n=1 Tax=Pisolithus orientalis TaxID=936130 RepID=UPI0022251F49|nr:uncharacterized protein F5J12DRAFT_779114 [Pisolithus orientalis]KAI6032651.1 hypothetical protein F5J12DRAFT_779114 [Pisolithus orientalis]
MSFPYKETSKSAAIPGGLKGRTETGNGIRRTGMVSHSTRIDLSKESRRIAVHHPHLSLAVLTAWLTVTSVAIKGSEQIGRKGCSLVFEELDTASTTQIIVALRITRERENQYGDVMNGPVNSLRQKFKVVISNWENVADPCRDEWRVAVLSGCTPFPGIMLVGYDENAEHVHLMSSKQRESNGTVLDTSQDTMRSSGFYTPRTRYRGIKQLALDTRLHQGAKEK